MSSKEALSIGQQRIGHLSKLLTMRDVEGQFWSLTDNDGLELRDIGPRCLTWTRISLFWHARHWSTWRWTDMWSPSPRRASDHERQFWSLTDNDRIEEHCCTWRGETLFRSESQDKEIRCIGLHFK